MRHEIALIEWSDGDGGVRLLGRCADPRVVEIVQRHLVESIRGVESRPILRALDGREPGRPAT